MHQYHFPRIHVCVLIWYFFFSFWLALLCVTDSRFIHITINDPVPFHTVHFGRKSLSAGFPGGAVVKNPPANILDAGSILGLGKIPWRRQWQPIPVFLPGKSHGQRSLAGYSPRGCKESNMTEHAGVQPTPKQGVEVEGYALHSWGQSGYTHYLGFSCTESAYSPSITYLFISVWGHTDVNGCLFYTLACNSTQCELFCLFRLSQFWLLGMVLGWLLCPSEILPPSFCFWALPYLLVVQDALGLSCLLPVPVLESAASQRGPIPFIGGCYWERKI